MVSDFPKDEDYCSGECGEEECGPGDTGCSGDCGGYCPECGSDVICASGG